MKVWSNAPDLDPLIKMIEESDAVFAALSEPNKRRIAQMGWAFMSPYTRHKYYLGTAAFSTEQMRELWGNLRTRNEVVKNFFRVVQGGKSQKSRNSYLLYSELFDPLIAYMRDPKLTLLMSNDKPLVLPKTAIASRTAITTHSKTSKNSVWQGTTVAQLLPINEQALLDFTQQRTSFWEKIDALRLLRLSRNSEWPGMIPVHYHQAKTGRIFDALFHVQTASGAALSAALSGNWDYDIENAHFSILYHLAKRVKVETPTLAFYIENKSAVRKEIADWCDMSLRSAKEVLIAMMYGAKVNGGYEYSSLRNKITLESFERLKKHPVVIDLNKERKQAAKKILQEQPRHRGLTGNAIGIFARPAKSQDEALAFVLQGYEALALRAVIRHVGDEILLPMHDGWVSKRQLNMAEIEAVIESATGFPLKLDEAQQPKRMPDLEDIEFQRPQSRTAYHQTAVIYCTFPQWAAPYNYQGVNFRTDLKK